MPCDPNSISSNRTRLSYAEEEPTCLKEAPTGGFEWYGLEPNSYSGFGAQLEKMARSPIDPNRQDSKGTIVDLEANGGFSLDLTRTNMLRLLQGFFFADIREKPTTQPINGASVAITAVDGVNSQYEAASGLTIFSVGDLVYAEDFGPAANNGLKRLDAVASGAVDTVETLVAEASPPANARITFVGKQFPTGDLSVTVSSGIITVTSASDVLPAGILPGEWIFVGGDATATQFDDFPPGWVRVRSVNGTESFIADDYITRSTDSPVTDAGTGKTIRLFFGSQIKNELAADIVRRSYHLERVLGQGIDTEQAEYVQGAIANECVFNLPGQDKVTLDLTFLALDVLYRAGETGVSELLPGDRNAALGEDAFNTTSDVSFMKLALADESTSTFSNLFAYVMDGSLTLSNNANLTKALGVLGAIDVNEGNFTVSLSLNAYFRDVAALQAVRDNADASFTAAVVAKGQNHGFLLDVPLVQLSGETQVEKDSAIMIPLEGNGAQSKFGHTMLFQSFRYLPTVANP